MTVSILKSYQECVFRVGAIGSAVNEYLGYLGGDLIVDITADYAFPGGVSKTRKMDFSELDSIVKVGLELESITFAYMDGYSLRCLVVIRSYGDGLRLSSRADSLEDAEKGAEIFAFILSLVEKDENINGEDLNANKEANIGGGVDGRLPYPERVTLKWLHHNVPYKFWFWLAFLLVSAFGLGVYFAKTPAYELFQSF